MGFAVFLGALFLAPNPNRAWILPELEYASVRRVPMKDDVAAAAVVAAMALG